MCLEAPQPSYSGFCVSLQKAKKNIYIFTLKFIVHIENNKYLYTGGNFSIAWKSIYVHMSYSEISARRKNTAKCPTAKKSYGKICHGEMSLWRSVLMADCPTAMCPTAKSPTAKCPVTALTARTPHYSSTKASMIALISSLLRTRLGTSAAPHGLLHHSTSHHTPHITTPLQSTTGVAWNAAQFWAPGTLWDNMRPPRHRCFTARRNFGSAWSLHS